MTPILGNEPNVILKLYSTHIYRHIHIYIYIYIYIHIYISYRHIFGYAPHSFPAPQITPTQDAANKNLRDFDDEKALRKVMGFGVQCWNLHHDA